MCTSAHAIVQEVEVVRLECNPTGKSSYMYVQGALFRVRRWPDVIENKASHGHSYKRYYRDYFSHFPGIN